MALDAPPPGGRPTPPLLRRPLILLSILLAMAVVIVLLIRFGGQGTSGSTRDTPGLNVPTQRSGQPPPGHGGYELTQGAAPSSPVTSRTP